MPKVSRSTATDEITTEEFEGRYGEAADMTVGFETYRGDADLRELLVGLPDDRCQSPHWGYVLKGRVVFHSADGDEEFVEGDAYYVLPGHTPEIFAGTEVVEFSPTDKLQETIAVATKNMEAAGS